MIFPLALKTYCISIYLLKTPINISGVDEITHVHRKCEPVDVPLTCPSIIDDDYHIQIYLSLIIHATN